MEFQKYNGGRLFGDADIALLNQRYVQDGEALDMLADTIGRSPRTLRRMFADLDLERRKPGPAPRVAVTTQD